MKFKTKYYRFRGIFRWDNEVLPALTPILMYLRKLCGGNKEYFASAPELWGATRTNVFSLEFRRNTLSHSKGIYYVMIKKIKVRVLITFQDSMGT